MYIFNGNMPLIWNVVMYITFFNHEVKFNKFYSEETTKSYHMLDNGQLNHVNMNSTHVCINNYQTGKLNKVFLI
jgi:hypothetical protein